MFTCVEAVTAVCHDVANASNYYLVCLFQLRLLRVFKLAQTWSTMRVLLSIILRTLSALGNLTFILTIVIYIFAVIGMQLFSTKYEADKFYPDEIPRSDTT